jgi:uncharacterized protein
MKFHLQSPEATLVTGLGDGWIRVGATEYRASCVLTPEGVVEGFAPGGFDKLAAADFDGLLVHRPEILLLGTGARQRFPHPRLSQGLTAARVGLEVMDSRAACRTYNILLGEGRRVVAAVMI